MQLFGGGQKHMFALPLFIWGGGVAAPPRPHFLHLCAHVLVKFFVMASASGTMEVVAGKGLTYMLNE